MVAHVDYDLVLKHIGQCRAWQWRNFFWLWLTSGAGGLAVVVWAFTAYAMPNRCAIDICGEDANSTFASDAFIGKNEDFAGKCKYVTPPAGSTCDSYQTYLETLSDENGDNQNIETTSCSYDDLIFDTSDAVETSLVRDWDLTCDRWINLSALGATYMLGMLVGSFVMGLLSDRFGRLKALMLSVILVSVAGFIGAFVNDPVSFGILRFLTGIGGIGCFMVTFVLAVEYVGPKYTMLIGIAIEIPFALGELVLGLEAYYVREWRSLQMVAYAPLIVLLLLWFVVDESPRWLLAAGKTEEALEIIKKGAKINQRSVPEDVLSGEQKGGMHLQDSGDNRTPTFFDLFRPRLIALRSANMMYQWFSVTMCYYGLSFSSTSLAGDAYSNFCLSVFVEIPGYLFCIFVMDCWGRRPILSFCQAISGVFCILAGLLAGHDEWGGLQVVFSLAGKFGASACFAIVYVYTAELFPTIIRNTAIGSCSTVARVGGILCLIVIQLNNIWDPLPMLIMGCVAVVAGCLAIFFPETVRQPLPETMEEAINIGKDSDRGICTCICPKSLGEMFNEEDD